MTSADLRARYGCSHTDLRRWMAHGWIEPEQDVRGSGHRFTWPRWCERVVAVLMAQGGPAHRREIGARSGAHRAGPGTPWAGYSDMVAAVGWALMDDPEVPWLVCVDGQMWPCWTAEEVVETLTLEPGPLRILVSPAI